MLTKSQVVICMFFFKRLRDKYPQMDMALYDVKKLAEEEVEHYLYNKEKEF